MKIDLSKLQYLIGMRIIRVSEDSITLDDGRTIYLTKSEMKNLEG